MQIPTRKAVRACVCVKVPIQCDYFDFLLSAASNVSVKNIYFAAGSSL